MTGKARVTLVQFERDADDPAENLHAMQEHVRRHRDSDLVVFPELALHGHGVAAEGRIVGHQAMKAVTDDAISAFHDFVAGERASVVYGALLEREGRIHNVATFTDGQRMAHYAKSHVHWTEDFHPGTEFPIVETRLGPTGMLICFDAAFPEVPRILALKGAQVILNLSAIPDHFPIEVVHRRLVGCSVFNQVWTIFCNRLGEGFAGRSAVVSPEGELVADAGKERSLTVEIEPSRVRDWREREPLLPHRRPNLYGPLSEQR